VPHISAVANRAEPVSPAPLAVARWCAAQGWPVHPLAPGRKGPAANCDACRPPGHSADNCACIRASRWCHGFHAATTDLRVINAWWTTNPRFGIGVSCGPAGLIVIDIDAHAVDFPSRDKVLPGIPIHDQVDLTGLANGYHSLALLAALRGQPSPAADDGTLRVRTPSGGLHVWYQAGPHYAFSCSSSTGGGRAALAWQVDVRAHGGYIIAPGTTTEAGTYTPIGKTRTPAPLPDWLAGELARTGHHMTGNQPGAKRTAYVVPQRGHEAVVAAGGGHSLAHKALATVLADVAACAAATEGTGFSERLNRAAYTAGGLVAAGYLTETDAHQMLEEAADHARPGQERRSRPIIRSGLTAGAARPLHVRGSR
jgi:bifunctional DNA primase/polymerase-like protein